MVLMPLIIPFGNLRLFCAEDEESGHHSLTRSESDGARARRRHEIQIVSPKNKKHSRGKTCD